jgi:hypothetical protein
MVLSVETTFAADGTKTIGSPGTQCLLPLRHMRRLFLTPLRTRFFPFKCRGEAFPALSRAPDLGWTGALPARVPRWQDEPHSNEFSRSSPVPFRLDTAFADMTDEIDFDWPDDPGAERMDIGLGEIVVAILAFAAFAILGRRAMATLTRERLVWNSETDDPAASAEAQ